MVLPKTDHEKMKNIVPANATQNTDHYINSPFVMPVKEPGYLYSSQNKKTTQYKVRKTRS